MLFQLLCFFLLPLVAIATLQQMQYIERIVENNSEIVKCTEVISNRYFLQPQNVEIIFPKSLRHLVFDFKKFGIVIRNSSNLQYPDFRRSLVMNAMIFLKGIDYNEDIKLLSTLIQFHPQGRFIVFINNENDSQKLEKYISKITFYLESIERWNIVFLTIGRNRSIRIYAYTMFTFGHCSKPKLIKHGSCENLMTLNNLFSTFINFHKCPIRLSTMIIPPYSMIYEKNGIKYICGVEANIANLIIRKLNATLEVLEKRNGTAIRDSVKKRNADMAVSYMLQFKIAGTTWTQSYIFIYSMIIIPQSILMPPWMNLILPFQVEIWATLGMVICVDLILKLLIPPIRRQFPLEWLLLGFFYIGITKLPTRFSERLYSLSWLIFGYIVMQAYSASLTGFFVSPGQYKGIQTLDELGKSEIVISGLKIMRNQFAEMNPRIFRNWKVITEAEYFENVGKLKAGTGGKATYAPSYQIWNITRGQESNFIVIPEHIGFYPLAMLLPNSSLILKECNRVIGSVFEAGLIQFWERSFMRNIELGDFAVHHKDANQNTSPINQGMFYFILCVGYSFSIITFVVELILAKVRSNTTNK